MTRHQLFAAALASLTAAGAGSAAPPNVLFAIADDWSWPHAGAYGCRWVRTPAFDRVAAQGLLFERAYTPNAKCAPSRACILTGRNPWQLGAAANHVCVFPREYASIMEVLGARGWHVGCVGKGWAPGDPQGRALTGRAYNRYSTTPPTPAISRNDYAANFEEFLRARPAGAPFFFWYGASEPHREYEYRAAIERGGRRLEEVDRVPAFWPDHEVIRTDLLDYAFEVEHFDRHLGRMLEILEQSGELSNTVVIVTADNGMPFPRCKGNCYEAANHLPLAVMWLAGIRNPGRRVSDLVSFIDLAPTWLELAGLTPETAGMPPMAGRSLSDIFADQAGRAPRDYVLIGTERHDMGRPHDWGYPMRGLVERDWLYIRNYEPMRWPVGNPETGYMNTDGSPTKTLLLEMRRRQPDSAEARRWWELSFGRRPAEELYDLRSDPDCVTNLAGRAEMANRVRAMRAKLDAQLAAEGDLRAVGRGREYEAHPYANPAHARFYERFRAGEAVRADWIEPTDIETNFYAAPPVIRAFRAEAGAQGVRLTWDVSGNPLAQTPTELIIEPHVGWLAEDAGSLLVTAHTERVWTLIALNPAGTNRMRAEIPTTREAR
ncbi:MAG: sulfatase [Kiritimatiellae bacterium]|nr:sulfatase [Kiritimatiellia bacterium]